MSQPLRILMLSAEMVPFAKVGGPADVVGALPKALHNMGHDVRVAMPFYRSIMSAQFGFSTAVEGMEVPLRQSYETTSVRETTVGSVPVYFVDAPRFFQRETIYGYTDDGERFILFCRAALELCRTLDWSPDIIHAHEWHTAIVPNWLHTLYRDDPIFAHTATVFTIHNMTLKGIFGHRILEVAGLANQEFVLPVRVKEETENVVGLMERGIIFADAITTVSETYAHEILTSEYGQGLEELLQHRASRLAGVLNGIDTETLNPATDPYIAQQFDKEHLEDRVANKIALQRLAKLTVDPDIPLIGFISRLSRQKGCDLLNDILEHIIELGAQIIIVGTGDSYYHEMFSQFVEKYPKQAAAHFTFGADWTQPLYAGSDMYLMPSLFEPCGLNQMIAMRYGSIPIVRSTGGLTDTVFEFDPQTQTGTGFVFDKYDDWSFFSAITRAIQSFRFKDEWQALMARAMSADHSWQTSAEKYVDIYERAIAWHQQDIELSHPSDFGDSFPTPEDIHG